MLMVWPTGGFMDTQFRVAPLAADYVLGSMAPALLEHLAERYQSEIGITVKHWAMCVFTDNYCTVPVPTQINNNVLPMVRSCRMYRNALEHLRKVQMHDLTEADKFLISTTLDQLDELISLACV
jgi:hypothetical protein